MADAVNHRNKKDNDGAALRNWIANEITSQLMELKQQINIELTRDLGALRNQIVSDVTCALSSEIDRKIKIANERASADISRMRNDVANMSSQLVVANDNNIALIKQNTKELMTGIGQHVCNQVYDRVVDEINTTIVPKVDNMVKWVNYNTQDTVDIVDKYRRAVEKQSHDPTKLITDGSRDSRIITPHVRMLFGED